MAYLPRLFRPDSIYFITSRTIDGFLFLRPSDEVNNAIGGVLADAQERYGVELFDFVFLSNHMHLAARSREGRIPEFMQYLKANIAVLINQDLQRHGHFWERRYMASPILDDGAMLELATYIYGHGVKEGLVDRSHEWPGVASIKERLTGERPSYQRVDLAGLTRDRLRRKDPPQVADYTRTVQVQLSPWPFLIGLSDDEAREQVRKLVSTAEERASDARGGRPALGVDFVLQQSPWTRPTSELQRTPKPLCHARSRREREAYREVYCIFVADYRRASRVFRAGDLTTRFPHFSFPPPLPLTWVEASRDGPGGAAIH